MTPQQRKRHRLLWVLEDLSRESSFLQKAMFGCQACYLHGQMKLALAARNEEPWRGVLIPTDRPHHPSLLKQFPALKAHPVLKKWLYLAESSEGFEETAQSIVEHILARDERFGVR